MSRSRVPRIPSGRPLRGSWIRMHLLAEPDLGELGQILCDPAIYEEGYVMHGRPASPGRTRALARSRFLAGQGQLDGKGRGRIAYAIRLADEGELGDEGTLVGTAALLEADVHNERIHLGATLYGRRWWGTRVNAEAKLLLLTHCFEDCHYRRVKIQTDLANTRSIAAIERLGAQREGVLRHHTKREDGTFRDTVVFSILEGEWPAVKAGLEERLARTGGGSSEAGGAPPRDEVHLDG